MLIDLINTIKDDDTIWVMENRENSDKIFKEYVTDKLFSATYAIVSKKVAYIFVHKLDEGNIKVLNNKYCKVFIYCNLSELKDYINNILIELRFPKNMLLNYTTMSDESTDIITHSSYIRISKLFRNIYKENDKKVSIKSAQMNIYDIISKNTNDDISRLKELSKITDYILKEAFYSIKAGQTEKEVAVNTRKIAIRYLEQNKEKYDIINYDFAWDICPIVLSGVNLKKGGHALPSNKKIEKGDTIYFDFGIKAVFKDNKILYTDMQRMGYVLNNNEKDAPQSVKNVFNVLVSSIKKGMKKMKPGIKGYVIDNIVRGEILKNNYPDYPHATGHPVGKEVHGGGALISIKSGKRANLKLVENGIYTLEPRVDIENGGSIEEMILVTKDGGIPLCNLQNELYLI